MITLSQEQKAILIDLRAGSLLGVWTGECEACPLRHRRRDRRSPSTTASARSPLARAGISTPSALAAFRSKINPPDLLHAPFPLGFAPPLKLGGISGDVIL